MSPHNVTNEQLVQFVLGELPSEKAREIEAHLRQCEPCRQAVGRLQSLLDCAERMSALPEDEQDVESANREVLLAAKTNDQDPIASPGLIPGGVFRENDHESSNDEMGRGGRGRPGRNRWV